MFSHFEVAQPDTVLKVNRAFNIDERSEKLNLGIGVYKNEKNKTPVFEAVKIAEGLLTGKQASKSYLDVLGSQAFIDKSINLLFGQDHILLEQFDIEGFQSVGGTGAISMVLQAVASEKSPKTIWIPEPTWENHVGIANFAGYNVQRYQWPRYNMSNALDHLKRQFESAGVGDVVVLHANCQNPTGNDLPIDAMRDFCQLMQEKKLFPIVDAAYIGFSEGWNTDAARLGYIVKQFDESAICVSFSKNFGLYRDRIGIGIIAARSPRRVDGFVSKIAEIARRTYSMPPDHGAAVISTILSNSTFVDIWLDELEAHRVSILERRRAFSQQLQRLKPEIDWSYLELGNGMFSLLPISRDGISELATELGLYILPSGRINIAALATDRIPEIGVSLKRYVSNDLALSGF